MHHDTLTIRAAAIADPLHPRSPAREHHLLVTIDPPEPGSLRVTIRSVRQTPADHSHPPILFPALINAHTHLDLTPVGPQPWDHGGAFADWARMILDRRRSLAPSNPRATTIREGIRLTLAGPTAAVADIAGAHNTQPARELAASPLAGRTFVELFGFGPRTDDAIHHLDDLAAELAAIADAHDRTDWAPALQPHAPYSADRRLYDAAQQTLNSSPILPNLIATHLAEHNDERALLTRAEGPMRDFLASIGSWDSTTSHTFRTARSPVAFLAPHLRATPALLAHVNDADDRDIETLAELAHRWRTLADEQTHSSQTHTRPVGGVVFCPRCHAYFNHPESFGPHRFQDMLDAGITVCLGTDSIVNLPPEQADRLSTLDDARLLHRTRAADPATILKMITINPATALGLDPLAHAIPPEPNGHTLAGLAFAHTDNPAQNAASGHTIDPNDELLRATDPANLVWNAEGFHPALDGHLSEN